MSQSNVVREGYVSVRGGQVWFCVIGSGPGIPLLILHGGPGFPHDYLESLASLSNERPVVFYDQLGCGKSDRPEDRDLWRIERFLEELVLVRKALRLEQVHLLGHSWGSMLSIDYALMRPTGLVSLILASPCLDANRWIKDAAAYRVELPEDVQDILDRHEKNGFTDCPEYTAAVVTYYRRHLCRLDPWPDVLEKAFAGTGHGVYRTMWGPNEFFVTGTLKNYNRTNYLHEITVPTLFTCGRYDEATPKSSGWYQSTLPGSEIAIFEKSAHMAHLEETEGYLLTVRNFLGRTEEQSETRRFRKALST